MRKNRNNYKLVCETCGSIQIVKIEDDLTDLTCLDCHSELEFFGKDYSGNSDEVNWTSIMDANLLYFSDQEMADEYKITPKQSYNRRKKLGLIIPRKRR